MKKEFHVVFSNFILFLVLSMGFIACTASSKDADIKAEVEKTLKGDPGGENVLVEVKDGVVILTGTSLNEKSKELCTMRVETVPYVKSVVNNCTVLHETELDDNELNQRLIELTKDLSALNSVKFGAVNGIVSIAGPVTRQEWKTLKANIDKLKPKGYDTAMLRVE